MSAARPRRRTTARVPGRAVGYVRVSTADQAEAGHSLDAQRQRIAAYCEARGWQLVEVYADEGRSAMKDRPEFERMKAEVLADGVSHVVALKLDRLGRRAKDLLDLYDSLERKGVALVCIEDSIDTSTPSGRLMRTVLAAVAEFERDTISERTRIGLEAARAKGVRLGKRSTLPAATIRRIRRHRSEGLSYRAVAALLNDDGVATGQGGAQWHASTVRAALLAAEGEGR